MKIATTEIDAIKTLVQAGFLPKETLEISDREKLLSVLSSINSSIS